MILHHRQSVNAGGVPEGSRGLSESASDTPGQRPTTSCTLKRCQNRSIYRTTILRPLQGRKICAPMFRGCRFAQPPATFCHPSGMKMPRLRAATSAAEKAVLQNAVTATDHQIDALVHELYALTPEEIALVEGRQE